jgi:hypothetical protein
MEKKRDLGRVRDLRKILLAPLENFEYMPFSEAKSLAPKSEVATVHISNYHKKLEKLVLISLQKLPRLVLCIRHHRT